jgi:hypothetical protein
MFCHALFWLRIPFIVGYEVAVYHSSLLMPAITWIAIRLYIGCVILLPAI